MRCVNIGIGMTVLIASLAFGAENIMDGALVEKAAGQSLGPMVQYHVPGQATVKWETEQPGASRVILLLDGKQVDQVEDRTPRKKHELILENLEPNTVYNYVVCSVIGGEESRSGFYGFDTTFNYTLPVVDERISPFPVDELTNVYSAAAEYIVEKSGIQQGYALVYGFGQGRLAWELLKRTSLVIVGLDDDRRRVEEARVCLKDTGLYGTRVTVRYVASLADTSLTGNFANLIVSDRSVFTSEPPGTADEVLRLLRPAGGVALIGGAAESNVDALQQWLKVSEGSPETTTLDVNDDGWIHIVRAALPGTGSWTHQYGRADNATNSGEELCGAVATTDLEVQWLGRPGADFGIDRNPRMPAPLAVNGRLFHQGLNRMAALDAYNGTILWLLEIPALRRVNMPRDCSNWCADDDFLYVAVENLLWQIEVQTGTLSRTYSLPEDRQDGYDWGFVAQEADILYGSPVVRNAMYKDFWGGASWYDKTSGAGTYKICSDKLFACEKGSDAFLWQYEKGAIINSTITLADGRLYFVESRHADLTENRSGRIETDALWLEQFLVALDIKTGEVLWEESIDTVDGVVVFFLSYADEHLLLLSSNEGSYYLYGYAADTGKPVWKTQHPWLNDNHGTHMQHAAIAGGVAYVEPVGYDIRTGEVVTENMGKREGCATVVATRNALLYRGQQRRIAMWDMQSEEVTSWANLRPSCWLSMVTADGMLLVPEGGGGCSCGGWIETSIGFLPVASMKNGG